MQVPDRGGRPRDTHTPPEMSSFEERTEAPQQHQQSQEGGTYAGRGMEDRSGTWRIEGG